MYVYPRTPQVREGEEGIDLHFAKQLQMRDLPTQKFCFFPPFLHIKTQIGYNGRSARVVSYVVCPFMPNPTVFR